MSIHESNEGRSSDYVTKLVRQMVGILCGGTPADAIAMLDSFDSRPEVIGVRLVGEALQRELNRCDDPEVTFGHSLAAKLFSKEHRVQAQIVSSMAVMLETLLTRPEGGGPVKKFNRIAAATVLAAAVPMDKSLHGVFRRTLGVSRRLLATSIQLRAEHMDSQNREWVLVPKEQARAHRLSDRANEIVFDWLHSDEASRECNSDRAMVHLEKQIYGFRRDQFEYLAGILLGVDKHDRKCYTYHPKRVRLGNNRHTWGLFKQSAAWAEFAKAAGHTTRDGRAVERKGSAKLITKCGCPCLIENTPTQCSCPKCTAFEDNLAALHKDRMERATAEAGTPCPCALHGGARGDQADPQRWTESPAAAFRALTCPPVAIPALITPVFDTATGSEFTLPPTEVCATAASPPPPPPLAPCCLATTDAVLTTRVLPDVAGAAAAGEVLRRRVPRLRLQVAVQGGHPDHLLARARRRHGRVPGVGVQARSRCRRRTTRGAARVDQDPVRHVR